MAKWEYNPVAIRYQNKHHIYASSGIHLIIKDGDNKEVIIDDFVLTLNHIPNVSNYQIIINEITPKKDIDNEEEDDENVMWGMGRIREFKDIEFNKLQGFDLFPIDSFPRESTKKVQLLKLTSMSLSKSGQMINLDNELEISDRIKLKGYPFNLTNSLIFSNYQTFGNIVGKCSTGFYLTDIRYVENLNGGIVLKNNSEVLSGLIFGNLRKRNGDGDLIVIIDIQEIISLLNIEKIPDVIPRERSSDMISMKMTKVNSKQSRSILPLLITDSQGNSTWGTSIHYTRNILITNQHVIEPYSSNTKKGICQIQLPTNQIIQLSSKDEIIIPIKNLDLAFILIKDLQNQKIMNSIPIIKGIGKYNQGDKIYSLSYGLFYQSGMNPLYSQGEINCIYSIISQIGIKSKINGLIITSCNVWNGSSGGGLFTQNDDLLIGLICSNANVRIPIVDNINEFKLEKNTSFLFIIPIDIIEYVYYCMILGHQDVSQLNENLIKLWNLQSFHQDILIQSTKL